MGRSRFDCKGRRRVAEIPEQGVERTQPLNIEPAHRVGDILGVARKEVGYQPPPGIRQRHQHAPPVLGWPGAADAAATFQFVHNIR